MDRAPGLSVRFKLTLSYAGFLMLAGVLLVVVVWAFLPRYVPNVARAMTPTGMNPNQGIARVHDGSLTIVPRPAGGLRIAVHLPTAPLVQVRRDSSTPRPCSCDAGTPTVCARGRAGIAGCRPRGGPGPARGPSSR
ncbi:hypothetical protein GCM10022419_017270 [Nonomuraea rosea]|uniref:Uncharacterized protein n=1 Tax=Nonomuraea rosea TaxID=638574 RepID=A0ABP6VND2_9ACTN